MNNKGLLTVLKSITAMALALGANSSFAAKDEAKMKIDATASKLEWMGKKITKQEHKGTINIKSGDVAFKGKTLVGGEFVVDMKTIKDMDLTDAEYNKKLVGHLNSEDFFATEKHAEAKLVIKSVKETAPGKADVTADLTIKGTTLPVNFPAEIAWQGDKKVTAKGKLVVDRTKYGIKYNSGKFFKDLGDKLIDDNFELSFELTAQK